MLFLNILQVCPILNPFKYLKNNYISPTTSSLMKDKEFIKKIFSFVCQDNKEAIESEFKKEYPQELKNCQDNFERIKKLFD